MIDSYIPSGWLQSYKEQARKYDRQTENTNNKNDLQKKIRLGTVSKKITGGKFEYYSNLEMNRW